MPFLIPTLAGLLFGFFSAIPVAGPLSALILAQAMGGRYQSARGLAAGVAGAEAFYAFAAYWGAGVLLVQYPMVVPIARGVAAVLLFVLGVMFTRGWPAGRTTQDLGMGGKKRAVAVGLGLGLLNPSFLATWSVAATALLGTDFVESGVKPALGFGLGAGIGTFAWFGSVPGWVQRYRSRLSKETIARVGKVTGWALIAVALALGGKLLLG